jgi:hypothetical protein
MIGKALIVAAQKLAERCLLDLRLVSSAKMPTLVSIRSNRFSESKWAFEAFANSSTPDLREAKALLDELSA